MCIVSNVTVGMLQAANHRTIHVRLRESFGIVLYIILYTVHVHAYIPRRECEVYKGNFSRYFRCVMRIR